MAIRKGKQCLYRRYAPSLAVGARGMPGAFALATGDNYGGLARPGQREKGDGRPVHVPFLIAFSPTTHTAIAGGIITAFGVTATLITHAGSAMSILLGPGLPLWGWPWG